jgi:hypothetical protein
VLSNGVDEVELTEGGKDTKVTKENLTVFINLVKEKRLNENP